MTLMFEKSRRVPGGKFRGGEVRNLPPETRLRILGREGEVEQDAPHALALEVERLTVCGGERRLRERLGDLRFGGFELAAVDQLPGLAPACRPALPR